ARAAPADEASGERLPLLRRRLHDDVSRARRSDRIGGGARVARERRPALRERAVWLGLRRAPAAAHETADSPAGVLSEGPALQGGARRMGPGRDRRLRRNLARIS